MFYCKIPSSQSFKYEQTKTWSGIDKLFRTDNYTKAIVPQPMYRQIISKFKYHPPKNIYILAKD